IASRAYTNSQHALGCSGIAVISVFRACAPKIYREAFATSETVIGEPCRVPNGRLKLVPWSRWSLGACRPVSGGCLLVSGAGPASPVRKGVRERSGCPGLCAYKEIPTLKPLTHKMIVHCYVLRALMLNWICCK
ncbi:hypothetical protein CRG98_049936, partial [Punica granatum]